MECRKYRIFGIVQGVGFRPFVKRLATRLGICGSVKNKGSYVEVLAGGAAEALERFGGVFREAPPERAVVLRVDEEVLEREAFLESVSRGTFGPDEAWEIEKRVESGEIGFQIVESSQDNGEIYIPVDIGICANCQRELFDPGNRRYLHPFINCTDCGPRLTILDSLPYDRERTSMGAFPMCPECAQEYGDEGSRRFDAQPVCCPDCGPTVYILEKGKRVCSGQTAVREAAEAVKAGKILALKGIGGFHLVCDAANPEAVQRLRERKRRPRKPFALMARDMDVVRHICEVSDEEAKALASFRKPIVLMEKRRRPAAESTAMDQCGLSGEASAMDQYGEAIAPDNHCLGVMLPYAPVHLLLFAEAGFPDYIVCTSANRSGAPIIKDEAKLEEQLAEVYDVCLSHDREIRTRADDSVLFFFEGKEVMVRRSRGYAPEPLDRPDEGREPKPKSVLAIGGELKNAFVIRRHNLYYPSSYIGDMTYVEGTEVLEETITRFTGFLETEPEYYVCDLHPNYESGALARRLSQEQGGRLVEVQHHYAHILSCMVEHGVSGPVIGIAFDGTGYGTDGSIWGGEILRCDRRGFERVSSLAPFLLPGGDAASREGYRPAVSLLLDAADSRGSRREIRDLVLRMGICTEQEFSAVAMLHDRKMNTAVCSSMGRLFDGAAAVLGIAKVSTYEGDAAAQLQYAAEEYLRRKGSAGAGDGMHGGGANKDAVLASDDEDIDDYGFKKPGDAAKFLDGSGVLYGLLMEREQGGTIEELAYLFHHTVARKAAESASRAAKAAGIPYVALSGGCFLNRLLLRLVKGYLEQTGVTVLLQHQLPANDGGIAMGQAYYQFSDIEA